MLSFTSPSQNSRRPSTKHSSPDRFATEAIAIPARPHNDGLPWTREQLILAFELYCRIPFQQTKASNPRVRELAAIIARTPASIARKLGNFGAFDPQLARQNIVGLPHGSKLDRQVWDEFHQDWNGLIDHAHMIKTALLPPVSDPDITLTAPAGPSTRLVTVQQRLHQSFFRDAVLSSYDCQCCVTGITIPECLVAGHIIPWSRNEGRRADPTNGLCLSATFDRLFDSGLITIASDMTLHVAPSVRESHIPAVIEFVSARHGQRVRQPTRFPPDPKCLQWHRENIFRGN